MRPAAGSLVPVEEHLSAEGTFLLGDAQTVGFPIRYASPGFEQLYGLRGAEIVGRKCGDLIGGPCIVANTCSLATAAATGRCTLKDAEARIRFLTAKAGEACRAMMAAPGSCVGVALLLNRKKGGILFTCECLVLNLQHPNLRWSYCVGFQRDISHEVSAAALLSATSEGDYARLLASRGPQLERRRTVLLGPGRERVLRCLHERALSVFSLDIWRSLRSDLIQSAQGDAVPVMEGPPALDDLSARAGPAEADAPGDLVTVAPVAGPGPSGRAGQVRPPVRTGDVMPSGRAGEAFAFLHAAGLGRYAETLLLNGFEDLETLLDISEEDMQELGIARGHRHRLRRSLRRVQCMQLCDGPEEHPAEAAPSRLPAPPPAAATEATPASSWALLQAYGLERAGLELFRRLFELQPEAERLFPAEVRAKHRDWDWSGEGEPALARLATKVFNIVGCAVAGQHDPQQLVPMLVELGARHVGYGVMEEHFVAMGRALEATLQACLGAACTPEVAQAWQLIYGFVSATMLTGVRAKPKVLEDLPTGPGEGVARRHARTLLQRLHGPPEPGEA